MKRTIDKIVILNRYFLALILLSMAILLISFANEYLIKEIPCKLCKLQRIPYLMIVGISLFGLFSGLKNFALIGIKIGLLLGFAIAIYHMAIQFGYVADPCTVQKNFHDIASFKMMLQSVVPCSKKSWVLFGLPISFYNGMICIVLLTFTIQISKYWSKNVQRV